MANLSDDRGFVQPDFSREMQLAPYLAECGPERTTRGTFFQFTEDVVREAGVLDDRLYENVECARERRHWVPWKTYSLRDYMYFCWNAGKIVHPDLPIAEGLRRMGAICYPSFAGTMAGRVVLFAFGQEVQDVFTAGPKIYGLAVSGTHMSTLKLGDDHYRVALRDVPNFTDTYQAGVFEGFIGAFGLAPRILVRRYPRLSDMDLDVRW